MSVEKPCGCGGESKESPPVKGCDCGCSRDDGAVGCGCGVEVNEAGSGNCCASGDEGRRRKLVPVVSPQIYRERRVVKGEVVTVIDVTFDSSGIELADAWSRAVRGGDVHEIMLWDPVGMEGEDAAAVAFIEFTQGGNIINGDEVRVDGEAVGYLAGFDYNHMPNHMNIVVEVKSLRNLFKLGGVVDFVPNSMLDQSTDCC